MLWLSTSNKPLATVGGGRGLPRGVEVLIALVGLVGFSPFLLAIAAIVRLSSPGPILFRQRRVGRRGRTFTLLKFRSMRVTLPGVLVTGRGDPRVTALGRLLRLFKLDELPELWNVVRGEMSLVGPRPEVDRYVNLNDPAWQRVLEARPGITDPVTLRLRNEEDLIGLSPGDPEEFYLHVLLPYKLQGYGEYLGTRTAWSDLGVLGKTLFAVVWPPAAPPPTLEEIRAALEGPP